jgi:hypothetical protein
VGGFLKLKWRRCHVDMTMTKQMKAWWSFGETILEEVWNNIQCNVLVALVVKI